MSDMTTERLELAVEEIMEPFSGMYITWQMMS